MAFDKEQAKIEVQKLVEKYQKISSEGKIKSYNEEKTKQIFILPLFRALGWDIEDSDEVFPEEKISKGRVDYAFKIGGIPKLFIEAKALKEDLEGFRIVNGKKVTYVEQTINYAWHKGAVWAVLTDFEGIKVFNAEWKTANVLQNKLFELNYDEFLDKFDQLLLLSRESLEKGLIDKEAEKWSKKAKKIPVDKQLLNDLTTFRELLTKNILKNNSSKNLTEDELDESVQRIIDRLIFIRTLEDRGLEAPLLQSLVRSDKHKKLYVKLNGVFRDIDKDYNSKIFSPHLCEDLVIDDLVLEKIITGLFHTADNAVHYDFGAIDADVLGNIYEQYLGHILKKTEKRAKLADGKAHRKEQGIYYTPTYIVDYIVKNTIGELTKNKKFDLNKIKVLDPACGSGSFLIKAFDYLVALNSKKGEMEQTKLDFSSPTATYGKKVEILKNNVFGVDLDPRAVEIAQLNLLLKTAEKKHRLPILKNNIKCGNSLIDDSAVAGKRAFVWNEEFNEIIEEGGFDVVVGNPPYVFTRDVEFQDSFKDYVNRNYFRGMETTSKSHARQAGKVNLYALFLIKGIQLLKESGLFGFIIPNNVLRTTTYDTVRKFILDNCKILQIVDLGSGVFEGVTASTIILVLQKELNQNKRNKNKVVIYSDIKDLKDKKEVEQKDFLENTSYTFNITLGKNERKIFSKIEEGTTILGKEAKYIIEGIVGSRKHDVVDNRINEKCKKFLVGKDIGRYRINFKNKYIIYDRERLHRARPEEVFISDKIVIQRISGGNMPLTCVLDKDKFYTYASTNLILLKNGSQFNLAYITGLLNSKLINWYYANKFTNKSSLTVNISKTFLEQIPIKIIPKSRQEKITELVDKMLSLNKKLNEIGDKKTDEKVKTEEEIKKVDREIDELVYKLYGLTSEEIKIVEGVKAK